MMKRKEYIIKGQVQGVGFRPFVYNLAEKFALTGKVKNTEAGVLLEIQGLNLDLFHEALLNQLPPLAKIRSFTEKEIQLDLEEKEFHIEKSVENSQHHQVLISPDMAPCRDCVEEMLDKNNRRYLYPFINCTHCGPRFTITHSIPYDRINTSMACFPMCQPCLEEYTYPKERRFHAQPTACHTCGVKLWTEDNKENFQALASTIKALHAGKIVAIKGLGGFHLACDAFNINTVSELRLRKNRPDKSFAIMVKDIAKAKEIAYLSSQEEAILLSPQRPVVICERKDKNLLSYLNPTTSTIGIMLPSTPLHILLFHGDHFESFGFDALVMTSGNKGGDPICLSNREAQTALKNIADSFLFHNRDILVRVDDSVLQENLCKTSKSGYTFFRRARGFVPELCEFPQELQSNLSVLGLGAELKATCCVSKENGFTGQHVGDMANYNNHNFLEETADHLIHILGVEPKIIVHDAHPNASAQDIAIKYQEKFQGEVLSLQHHAAHAFSLLADNCFDNPCLVIVLDGTGYGLDNTIWGGELLYIDPKKALWERLGHFQPILMPGADAAIRKPWYMTEAYIKALHLQSKQEYKNISEEIKQNLHEVLENNMGIQTTSCGRLFDAIGALLGCPATTTFEGQTAMALEALQDHTSLPAIFPIKVEFKNNMYILNTFSLFQHIFEQVEANAKPAYLSRLFHISLAEALAHWATLVAFDKKVNVIGLSGGVFLNKSLTLLTEQSLLSQGLQPLIHQNYSPSDASISLGQVFYGHCVVRSKH